MLPTQNDAGRCGRDLWRANVIFTQEDVRRLRWVANRIEQMLTTEQADEPAVMGAGCGALPMPTELQKNLSTDK